MAAFLLSVFVSFIIWEALDPRSLPIFVLVVMVLEFAGQIHWKAQVICPHCGFDPVLYVKNPGLAAERVKDYLEKRKQDPRVLLSHNPDIGLTLRRRSQATKESRNGKGLVLTPAKKDGALSPRVDSAKELS